MNENSYTIERGPCANCIRRSPEDALVCSVDLGVVNEKNREVMILCLAWPRDLCSKSREYPSTLHIVHFDAIAN